MKFDTTADKTVTMRIATSLISVEQAQHNLELEIAPADTFETVSDRAQALWDDKLGVIEVEGATDDQLTTLYSNLYRLYLYPNSGVREHRHARRARSTSTPCSLADDPAEHADRDRRAGRRRQGLREQRLLGHLPDDVAGLLAAVPDDAGELVDGFVQQYRDGGWVSRWSSPGYANLMTGTSSDVAFTDAYMKGVRNLDAKDVYDAALKNATVAPPADRRHERRPQGPAAALFLGYTLDSTREGVSWALEGYINDFGIAHMAEGAGRRRARPRREAALPGGVEYFLEPRPQLREHVRPGDRLLPGPRADGEWKSTPEEYDPRVWGHEPTTPRPTAGTSPSTCRTTARAWPTCTAAATSWPRSSTRSSPRRRPRSTPAPTAASSTR